MPPRRFTRHEAERLLPRSTDLILQMQERKHRHDRLQEKVWGFQCWRLWEPGIAWWHQLETGFAGRQPLPERK